MPRFAPVWTDTETTHWQAGEVVREDRLASQIMQNIEYLAQKHDHSGDPGDGATFIITDPLQMWFYGPSAAG